MLPLTMIWGGFGITLAPFSDLNTSLKILQSYRKLFSAQMTNFLQVEASLLVHQQ